jgi:glycosyltransferase involved in cell wall biosynthesis
MAGKLYEDVVIVLIGLTKEQIKDLPKNIIGIERTENQNELAAYYSMANVFVNPSLAESFGLVTVEAQACGTPVVVFDNSASPELVKNNTGFVVPNGDIDKMIEATLKILSQEKETFSVECRRNVLENYNKNIQLEKYLNLYKTITQNTTITT